MYYSFVIKNKECALAHSGACGVAECQWHSFSNDRSEAQTLATSSLYAAVRILPEAFCIIGNAISYYTKKHCKYSAFNCG